jgi:hypothetical protein
MTKTYLVPEEQTRRYLVFHVVEARNLEEASCKALRGEATLQAERWLSTTHVPIELDDIVELQPTPEGG